jgi:hypothetical protein
MRKTILVVAALMIVAGCSDHDRGAARVVMTRSLGDIELEIYTEKERKIGIDFGTGIKGIPALNFEISMSDHHQHNMVFNGFQSSHLVICPA